jgi:hypothetical protein
MAALKHLKASEPPHLIAGQNAVNNLSVLESHHRIGCPRW